MYAVPVGDLCDEVLRLLVKVFKVVPVGHVPEEHRLLTAHVDGGQLAR